MTHFHDIWISFQEFGTHGSVLAESEYEMRMLAVFNHVLEEVENLSRKHPPVSYLVMVKCFHWQIYLDSLFLWYNFTLIFPFLPASPFLISLFTLNFKHTGCLCDAVIAILKVPLSFQRYFFQKLQSTSIKVSDLCNGI